MKSTWIHENLLLQNRSAQRLYHEFAQGEPILDYHSHLSAADLAANRQFANLYEIWLEGDHYKWRAMRAHGVAERCCTGGADPEDKFKAWARTVPHTLGNPLYLWSHLELFRYFRLDRRLDEDSASLIWSMANERLADDSLRVHGILRQFDVRALCTTDDPTDDLASHAQLAKMPLATRVFPTFRPDGALACDVPREFNLWVDRLEAAADVSVDSLASFLDALDRRHRAFHQLGCRLSDHGLPYCYGDPLPESEARTAFDRVRSGHRLGDLLADRLKAYLLRFFVQLDWQRNWTKQLHLGAARNNCTQAWQALGANTGFDSIGDWPQGERLRHLLDDCHSGDTLPRMVIYNANPADTYVMATILGSFQGGPIPGKLQLGAAWWFLDQQDGIVLQLRTLANTGLLSHFLGMLTDSRSFMSFPRHEYFRRILCNDIGYQMEQGFFPADFPLVGDLVRRICFANARNYLGLPVAPGPETADDG